MTRVMRCANHCSPVEMIFLKSLRELAHQDESHLARVFLDKIGLAQYQVFFLSLINRFKIEDTGVQFHHTESSFLSAGEMRLLALLAQASCKDKSPFTADSQSALHRSLNECGVILQQNKIKLRFRPGQSVEVAAVC